jgi:hypothetical protein
MNFAQANSILEEIRAGLVRTLEETATGRDIHKTAPDSHLAGKAGVGEADNVQDANDVVDRYIADIVDQLMVELGMEEEEAFSFVFSHLEKGSEENGLAPVPGEDADPEELASWLGKATTLGVSAAIVRAARER